MGFLALCIYPTHPIYWLNQDYHLIFSEFADHFKSRIVTIFNIFKFRPLLETWNFLNYAQPRPTYSTSFLPSLIFLFSCIASLCPVLFSYSFLLLISCLCLFIEIFILYRCGGHLPSDKLTP